MTLASSSGLPALPLVRGSTSPARRHHPAALVLALGFEVEDAVLPSAARRPRPRSAGAESRSRAAENRTRCRAATWFPDAAAASRWKSARQSPPFRCRLLNCMQRVEPNLLPRGLLLVRSLPRTTARRAHTGPSSRSRCAPAVRKVVISSGRRRAKSLPDAPAQPQIGHLNTGIVDVVLHVDLVPGGAQQAHKGVAENRIPQMPDVRGFVGIDAGVLDQGIRGLLRAPRLRTLPQRPERSGGAIQPGVDVSRARNLEGGEPWNWPERGNDFLRL